MKEKIVLFSPKPSLEYYYEGFPLSLLAISSLLSKECYDIKIIKASKNYNYKQEILNSVGSALAFGVTCMTGYPIKETLEISKLIKEKFPEIPVIWGGWHPTIMSRQVLENPYIDIVCRGQGERAFYELIGRLKHNESLDGLLGISYKKNNKIIENPDRPIEDINNFPSLPYHLINFEDCIMNTELGQRTVDYFSSQGCPHKCGFCAEPGVYKRKWFGLEAKRVVDNIEYLFREFHIDSIFFVDSNFFINEKRVEEICSGILERKIKIKWGKANGGIKELLKYNERTWNLMIKSGCKSIIIGAESGSQEILDLINKNISINETIELTKICKKYDIRIYYGFIVGFPPNPPIKNVKKIKIIIKDELKAILDLIDTTYSIDKHHIYLLFLYTPYPGTTLYNLSIENGFEEPKKLEDWSYFELNFKNTPWISYKYAKKIEFLRRYIFHLIGGIYIDKINNRFKGLKKIIFIFFANILQYIAIIRLKFRLLFFPIEYYIFKFLKQWLKKKIFYQ